MVASALFITDLKGKIIISRNYRGDIPMSVSDRFSRYIQEREEVDQRPVFTEDGITFVYIKCSNVFMVSVTKRNSNVALMLMFLYRLSNVFRDYFGDLDEESIRDNFVSVYELLDETMDFGYPQTCESRILRDVITQESHRSDSTSSNTVSALLDSLSPSSSPNSSSFGQSASSSAGIPLPPVALTNPVSWRQSNVNYRKNEIFLDVIERLNLLVSSTGQVVSSEITGSIQMKSYLSGMPELKLGLNDKLMFQATGRSTNRIKSVELEDVRFHHCVSLSRFENDRTISFIPPDGEFELLSYRLQTQVKPLIWVECSIETHSHSRIEFLIKAKSNFKSRSVANAVEIHVPVPHDCDSPSFKASIGSVSYTPDKNTLVWTIRQFAGQKEYLMRAHFGLPSIDNERMEEKNWKAPIAVKFEIPYFTVSGIQVRYLKIVEKSAYTALPWVRYITMNGEYQLRMN